MTISKYSPHSVVFYSLLQRNQAITFLPTTETSNAETEHGKRTATRLGCSHHTPSSQLSDPELLEGSQCACLITSSYYPSYCCSTQICLQALGFTYKQHSGVPESARPRCTHSAARARAPPGAQLWHRGFPAGRRNRESLFFPLWWNDRDELRPLLTLLKQRNCGLGL